jgi:hypothetical protein
VLAVPAAAAPAPPAPPPAPAPVEQTAVAATASVESGAATAAAPGYSVAAPVALVPSFSLSAPQIPETRESSVVFVKHGSATVAPRFLAARKVVTLLEPVAIEPLTLRTLTTAPARESTTRKHGRAQTRGGSHLLHPPYPIPSDPTPSGGGGSAAAGAGGSGGSGGAGAVAAVVFGSSGKLLQMHARRTRPIEEPLPEGNRVTLALDRPG